MKKYNKQEIEKLYSLAFLDLLFLAQTIHRDNFPKNEIELCKIISIKTGGCPEDCSYCNQSAHNKTSLKKEKLSLEEIKQSLELANKNNIKRFCFGAAWRSLNNRDIEEIIAIIKLIKENDFEACATLGMISEEQAILLKEAGLDFYNHNLDTSASYYPKIITTRTYKDRLETIKNISNAGINLCCGGIVGMGESREDRVDLLLQLSSLDPQPKSVPINRLIKFTGTKLEDVEEIDDIEFIRTIAVARIIMPFSKIRLSAGRGELSESSQILCFLAGANSIWLDERLLTADNREVSKDKEMLAKLGINQCCS